MRPESSEANRHGRIKLAAPVGLPLDRVDGRLKVTGKAPYAYEYAAQGAALCGIIVPASIGKGRVTAVDVQEARTAPGVRLVLTEDNAPPQHPFGRRSVGPLRARDART
jgi:xanthine dehydrogenase YagR molybdenum-binding subunit